MKKSNVKIMKLYICMHMYNSVLDNFIQILNISYISLLHMKKETAVQSYNDLSLY